MYKYLTTLVVFCILTIVGTVSGLSLGGIERKATKQEAPQECIVSEIIINTPEKKTIFTSFKSARYINNGVEIITEDNKKHAYLNYGIEVIEYVEQKTNTSGNN